MVCDSCLTAAYDLGIEEPDQQEMTMTSLGADVPDHLCDEVETEGKLRCGCACRRPHERGHYD